MDNFNGSRLKIKEKEMAFASKEGDSVFRYFEVISPNRIVLLSYLERDGKVKCL